MRNATVSPTRRAQLKNLAKGRAARKESLRRRKKVRIYDRVVDVLVMLTIRTTQKDLKEKPGGATPLNDAVQAALDCGALQLAFKHRSRSGSRIAEAYLVGEESGSRRKAP